MCRHSYPVESHTLTRYIDILESRSTQSEKALRLDGLNLPDEYEAFLQDIVSRCEDRTGSGLVSAMLFGSVVKGGAIRGLSDLDVVLVLPDSVSDEQLKSLEAELVKLTESHGIATPESAAFKGIPRFVMREAGMFKSCFVCRERDLRSFDFSRVFGANLFLTKLVVPSSIVLGDVLSAARTVYGRDVVSSLRIPRPTRLDVLRSMLMNELLAALAVFYYPFSENATKIAMEAVKWSVYNAAYVLTGESKSLSESMHVLAGRGIPTAHFEELKELRREYRRSLSFAILSTAAIARLHLSLSC